VFKRFVPWLALQAGRQDLVGVLARDKRLRAILPRDTSDLHAILRYTPVGDPLRRNMLAAHREWRKLRQQAAERAREEGAA
jgi:hypothetical protein